MLEKIADRLWLTEGEIVSFYGFPYPTRSVIARFDNGDLWVWSPVKLTDALKTEVDVLGRVAHLVSPNKIHQLYLAEWEAAYPDVCSGDPNRPYSDPELEFREPLQDVAPAEWQPEIDQAWFRGSFAMDEIVFLHRPSRTVIVAHLIEAFSDAFLKEYGLGGSALLRPSTVLSPARRSCPSNGACPSWIVSRPVPPVPRSSVGTANGSSWRTESGSAPMGTPT